MLTDINTQVCLLTSDTFIPSHSSADAVAKLSAEHLLLWTLNVSVFAHETRDEHKIEKTSSKLYSGKQRVVN